MARSLPDSIKQIERPKNALSPQRRTTMIVFLVLLAALMGLTLRMILPYLLAVFMGGILALLSEPVFRWLRCHHLKPRMASAVTTLGVLLLVIAPITFFVVKAVQQGIVLGGQLAEGWQSFRAFLNHVSTWGPFKMVIGSPEAFESQVRRWIQGAGTEITGGILTIAAQIPDLLLQLALASLACYFLLVDGKSFSRWIADKIPLDWDVRVKIVNSFKNTSVSVIWATLAAALAQSMIIWIGYLVLNVPAAFLAAGTTFIFAWIPMLGSAPIWLGGALYLYLKGSFWKTVLMLAFGIVTSISDNIIRPFVLKGRSKMHPLVSLVAIFGGINMFGIIGVFIGPILAALLISLLQIWPSVGIRFGLLSEPEKYRAKAL